jgi:hypothetical protein
VHTDIMRKQKIKNKKNWSSTYDWSNISKLKATYDCMKKKRDLSTKATKDMLRAVCEIKDVQHKKCAN